ncbi:MAG: hypothetical protein ACRYGF_11615 [Janthinobacterium lividum]
MTKPLKLSMACVLVATMPVMAQTSTTTTPKSPDAVNQTTKGKARKKAAAHLHAATRAEGATVDQVRSLRLEMQAQIDGLKAQLAERDTRITEAQKAIAAAQSQAIIAAARGEQLDTINAQNTDKIQTLQSTVADLQIANNGLTQTVINNKTDLQEQLESPTVLHYKGLTITPVAFFAFEGVYRNRSVNSDINTPFNTIPLPSANEGHVSELNFTGRQSRLGGLFEGNAGRYKLSGYFEADFLSAGVTSNNNQSESYTFRQRQIWGKIENKAGSGVTGGQMWSLVTENGLSTNNRTEKLPNTVDPQYMVGFNWARQPAIRVQQRFGDVKTGALTVAASLEEAQITNFTAASVTTGAVPTNFFFSGTGVNGGLYNAFNGTYANNVAPDVIVKAAYDLPKAHFEVGGLARFMRNFYYPIVSLSAATTANPGGTYTYSANHTSNTRTGGGAFGSARVSPSKFADIAVQVMAGQGTGRYGSSQLADATIRPDGTLEPLRNYHGLFSLETHPAKKLDVYGYYGGEYAQRTYYSTANGSLIGYAAPNLNNAGCYALPVNPASSTGGTDTAVTCAAPTRYIQEGMFGATYRLVNSPKYGRLQYQLTYSYLQRNLWAGSVTAVVANQPSSRPTGPRALDNMVHVGMRYYIP